MNLIRQINEALSEQWPGKYSDDDDLWPEDRWQEYESPSGVRHTIIGHNPKKGGIRNGKPMGQFRTHLGYTDAKLNPDGSPLLS